MSNRAGSPKLKLDMKLINGEKSRQLIGMSLKRGIDVEGSTYLAS